jgi:hypothetical protein
MANSLLDFVMSLVRDPDVAARYAADPAGAIADAHLSDVTSADVNNLIPMVSDSMSMAPPAIGGGGGTGGNVWTSGAATAAFDAFDAHIPASVVHDTQSVVTGVIQQPTQFDHPLIADPGAGEAVGAQDTFDSSAQLADADAGHSPVDDPGPDWSDHGGWQHTHVDDSHPAGEHSGFDIF